MKGFVRCVLLVPFICLSQPLLYPKDGGGDVSRIFWDAGSLATVFSPGNYCRIIELDDGRLLAAAEACGGRPVGMLWASPDCTHHSKARGKKPKDKKIRSLAWVVVRWARGTGARWTNEDSRRCIFAGLYSKNL